MEFLIHSYPKYVSVASLPCETAEAKVPHGFVIKCTTLVLNDMLKLLLCMLQYVVFEINLILQMSLAELLFEKGLIRTAEPLTAE